MALYASLGYYGNVTFRQLPVDQQVRFSDQVMMYSVPLEPNFIQKVAERTHVENNDVLNICMYNPNMHMYLIEINALCMKGGEARNVYLVILPPCDNFEHVLTSKELNRARTAKSTHFVNTLADFEFLL